MSRTILAIHAHPDDESSKGASAVAMYVAGGARAVLVTATGGEAGDVLNAAMDTPEVRADLQQVRAAELKTAADIIGFADVIMLGYRDSGMPNSKANSHPSAFCQQPLDDVLEKLVRIVRRERPGVVLGYDAHDFYPHPDHLMVNRVSVELVAAAADESRFPQSGPVWQIPKMYAPIFTLRRVRALHDAMLAATGSSPFSKRIDRMTEDETHAKRITRIDVTGYTEQGRDALRAHRTQVDPQGFWFAVPTEVVESVYPWEDFELLHSSVGWREDESSLFEGLS